MDNEQLHEANEPVIGHDLRVLADDDLAGKAYMCMKLSTTLPMEYMEDRFTLARMAVKFVAELKRRKNAKASN